MKIFQSLLLSLFALVFLSFSNISKKQVNTESHVKFSIKNAGITVNGQFRSFSTNIKFSKANIAASIFNGVINVSSIDTDIKKRDTHLKQEEYFNVAKHTGIVFISTAVTALNSNTLKVTGNLTMKAITKQVSLNVTYTPEGENTIFSTKLNLNRRDYGVGGKSIIMSDDVTLDLKFTQKTTK